MMDVMEDREVWRLNLELLPRKPSQKNGQWRKKNIKKTWITNIITYKSLHNNRDIFFEEMLLIFLMNTIAKPHVKRLHRIPRGKSL